MAAVDTTQVTTAYVKQYGDTLHLSVQQRGSRVRPTIMIQQPINGEFAFIDRIGSTEAQISTTRFGDSPLIHTPYIRRRVGMQNAEWGELIDSQDKLRMLIDPTSQLMLNATFALGRQVDGILFDAMYGTAYGGKDGAVAVTFPAGQQVAVNFGASSNTGLTVEKLREARRILRKNEVDPMVDGSLYIIVTATQLDNMLATTEVTSADFNSVKALVNGEINTFMGFNWVHSELVPVDGTSYRRVPAYASSAIGMGIGMEPQSALAPRPDKKFIPYAFYTQAFGAVRLEEEKIVEIKCAE